MSNSGFNTPPWFLDIVREFGPIGLDPCSNATSLVHARVTYTKVENGLIQPWRGLGNVFMNPPHSMAPNNIEPWMEKAHREFFHTDGKHTEQFFGLVPSKTGPAWFQNHAVPFHKCFLSGRLKFWEDGKETAGPGKFDSLVLYAGPFHVLFKSRFAHLGWCP